MQYQILADMVVLVHAMFVLFVVLGGLLVLKWKRWAWVHVPCVLWGAAIEFAGWICPLTPLENWLREKGGATGYSESFIERYLMPLLYPGSLTRQMQLAFGVIVLAFNVGVYAWLMRRMAKRTARRAIADKRAG